MFDSLMYLVDFLISGPFLAAVVAILSVAALTVEQGLQKTKLPTFEGSNGFVRWAFSTKIVGLAAWFHVTFTQHWHEILLRFVPVWATFAILGFFSKASFYNTIVLGTLLFLLVLLLERFLGKKDQIAAVKRFVNAIGSGGAALSCYYLLFY